MNDTKKRPQDEDTTIDNRKEVEYDPQHSNRIYAAKDIVVASLTPCSDAPVPQKVMDVVQAASEFLIREFRLSETPKSLTAEDLKNMKPKDTPIVQGGRFA